MQNIYVEHIVVQSSGDLKTMLRALSITHYQRQSLRAGAADFTDGRSLSEFGVVRPNRRLQANRFALVAGPIQQSV